MDRRRRSHPLALSVARAARNRRAVTAGVQIWNGARPGADLDEHMMSVRFSMSSAFGRVASPPVLMRCADKV